MGLVQLYRPPAYPLVRWCVLALLQGTNEEAEEAAVECRCSCVAPGGGSDANGEDLRAHADLEGG
jgi:hypothetical protein